MTPADINMGLNFIAIVVGVAILIDNIRTRRHFRRIMQEIAQAVVKNYIDHGPKTINQRKDHPQP